MILKSAPAPTTPAAPRIGSAIASAAGGEKSSFSALMGDAEAVETPALPAAVEPIAQPLRALAAALPDGNGGKVTGKILPPSAEDASEPGEAETTDDSDPLQVAAPDSAGMVLLPAALLSLPVAPLPGDRTIPASQAAVAGKEARNPAPSSILTTMTARLESPLETSLPDAKTAIFAPVAQQGSNGTQTAQNVPLPQHIPDLRLATVEVAPAQDATATPAPVPSTTNRLIATPQAQTAATIAPTTPPEDDASPPSSRPEKLAAAEPVRQANTAPTIPAMPSPATPAAAPVFTPAAVRTEAPQDFATLVSRLNDAREASGEQVVRTALVHREFGQVSLQLRHQDNGLSVTMASSDPAFTGSVQAAAAASLASNTGEQSQGGQQQTFTPQQQAGQQSPGTGAGCQDQQPPAAQTTRNFARSASAGAEGSDSDTQARIGRDGTRPSGLYA